MISLIFLEILGILSPSDEAIFPTLIAAKDSPFSESPPTPSGATFTQNLAGII